MRLVFEQRHSSVALALQSSDIEQEQRRTDTGSHTLDKGRKPSGRTDSQ